MHCPICEETVDENANVCPKCGHVFDDESKDIEHLINDILEEDEAETDDKAVQRVADGQVPEKGSGIRMRLKTRNFKETTIVVSRYAIGFFIVLSLIGLLFPWAVMDGRGVTEGFITDASTDQYIKADGTVQLSGLNIMSLAIKKGEEYQRIISGDGVSKKSIVATVHVYYMYAVGLFILLGVVALTIVLLPLRLKGQSIVRNLAGINLIIIGLNMLALKFIYFSAIAVQAKNAIELKANAIADVKYTLSGIAAGNDFYPYNVTIGKGFYFTVIVTGIWLMVALTLTELNNKEELDKIDQGA